MDLHEIWLFTVSVVSHWQAYVTGGTMTAFIVVIERLSGKALPKKVYAIVFLGLFLLVAFFLAWEDEHDRAGKLQVGSSANPPLPTLQVNVPPISVPTAQLILKQPTFVNQGVKKPYPQNLTKKELQRAVETLAKTIVQFHEDFQVQLDKLWKEQKKQMAPYLAIPQDQLTSDNKATMDQIWRNFSGIDLTRQQDQIFSDRFKTEGTLLRERMLDLLPRSERFSERSAAASFYFEHPGVLSGDKMAGELEILAKELDGK